MANNSILEVDIQNKQQDCQVPAVNKLQQWASAALLKTKNSQVSLMIVNAKESQSLNNEYRGIDKSTNVLSFPMELPVELIDTMDINVLGDLVVCASVVNDESQQQHKTFESHWAHMLVHGMLHLQGYDHIDNADADVMEEIEINIMSQLGFDNPYTV